MTEEGRAWRVPSITGYILTPDGYEGWKDRQRRCLTIAILAGLDRGQFSEEIDALWDEAEAKANEYRRTHSTEEEQEHASEAKD